jgi:hypothetical protein
VIVTRVNVQRLSLHVARKNPTCKGLNLVSAIH